MRVDGATYYDVLFVIHEVIYSLELFLALEISCLSNYFFR
jgi:hypothetical protein